jgi:hypothetical protein
VWDDEHIYNVQAACQQKRQRVAGNGAHVWLQVGGSIAHIHLGWPPNLDRENAECPQQSARIVDGGHRSDQPSMFLVSADDV